MSHWTKLKTKLTDKEYVTKALQRMGLEFQEGEFTITEYGKSETAQIKLNKAVGLSLQEDGTWAMVGDFYHAREGTNATKLRNFYNRNNEFNQQLSTAYAIEETLGTLEDQQFTCDNEEGEVGEDGWIEMRFTR